MRELIEAECDDCGETFIPADEDDLIHGGCGGTGHITGSWIL